MEDVRRCGWLPESAAAPQKCVWARGEVGITSCPTSYISVQSLSFLEEFHVWKLFGCADVYKIPARLAEAFFVLEGELRSEGEHAAE